MAVVPPAECAQQAPRLGRELDVVLGGRVGGWTAGLRGWQDIGLSVSFQGVVIDVDLCG